MSLELVHSRPSASLMERLIRLQMDVYVLSRLTRGEIRTVYGELETARDALSRIMDRADGKHA